MYTLWGLLGRKALITFRLQVARPFKTANYKNHDARSKKRMTTPTEMNHFMQNKRSGEDGYAALKLDMSKAYGRVEWPFYREDYEKIGVS